MGTTSYIEPTAKIKSAKYNSSENLHIYSKSCQDWSLLFINIMFISYTRQRKLTFQSRLHLALVTVVTTSK